jgi:hypothetical protein
LRASNLVFQTPINLVLEGIKKISTVKCEKKAQTFGIFHFWNKNPVNERHAELRTWCYFLFPFVYIMKVSRNFTHSDWLRTQNVNKRSDWLTFFTLVDTNSLTMFWVLEKPDYCFLIIYYTLEA